MNSMQKQHSTTQMRFPAQAWSILCKAQVHFACCFAQAFLEQSMQEIPAMVDAETSGAAAPVQDAQNIT